MVVNSTYLFYIPSPPPSIDISKMVVEKVYTVKPVHAVICIKRQGSPHIVKTGRLDFSISCLKGEVRENLGDFRKSIQILMFLSSLPHVPLPFTKRTCCTMILKRMQLTSLE